MPRLAMRCSYVALVLASCGPSSETAPSPSPKSSAAPTASGAAAKSTGPEVEAPPLPSPKPLSETTFSCEAPGRLTPMALALDKADTRYVVGSFGGTLTIGSLPPIHTKKKAHPEDVERDGFLLEVAVDGKPILLRSFGGSSDDRIASVVVDGHGDIYLGGSFSSATLDLGGAELQHAPSKGGDTDLFLAKLDKDGKVLWQKVYGDAEMQTDIHLALAPSGGVAATGVFSGTIDFGGATKPITSGSKGQFYAARIDADGKALWASQFGQVSNGGVGLDIAVGGEGNVWVSGGSEAADETQDDHPKASPKALAPMVVELDGSGRKIHAGRFGAGANNLDTAIAVGPKGVRFAAAANGTMIFGDKGMVSPTGSLMVAVASLDATAQPGWASHYRGGPSASVSGLAVDKQERSFLAGLTADSANKTTGFLDMVDANGTPKWSFTLKDQMDAWMVAVALDSHDQPVVLGAIDPDSSPKQGKIWLGTFAP